MKQDQDLRAIIASHEAELTDMVVALQDAQRQLVMLLHLFLIFCFFVKVIDKFPIAGKATFLRETR